MVEIIDEKELSKKARSLDYIVDAKEKEEVLHKLIRIRPDKAGYLISLAILYSYNKSVDKALETFDLAYNCAEKAKDVEYMMKAGESKVQLLRSLGEYESAFNLSKKLIEIFHEDVEIILMHCSVLDKLNRFEEAIELCDKARSIAIEDYNDEFIKRSLHKKVILLRNKGDIEESLDLCAKLIKAYPYYASFYTTQATILEKMGDYEFAKQILRDAKRLFHRKGKPRNKIEKKLKQLDARFLRK